MSGEGVLSGPRWPRADRFKPDAALLPLLPESERERLDPGGDDD